MFFYAEFRNQRARANDCFGKSRTRTPRGEKKKKPWPVGRIYAYGWRKKARQKKRKPNRWNHSDCFAVARAGICSKTTYLLI